MDNQPYYEEKEELTDKQLEEMKQKSAHIDSIIVGTFQTPLGKKCLEHLEKTFVDKDIYAYGMTFEQTTFRAGQAAVIRQLRKTLEGALNGR